MPERISQKITLSKKENDKNAAGKISLPNHLMYISMSLNGYSFNIYVRQRSQSCVGPFLKNTKAKSSVKSKIF